MRPHPTLTVISLGGGVQSSVLALMASKGAFDRIPDCAIFADTRWEPPSIYEHLTWLIDRLSFPLYVVDNGRSLREDVKALTNHSGSRRYVDIPVYLKGRDGEGDGIGRRQCTDNYKIRPIRRRIREMLGTRAQAARPRRNHRRAVAGHLHRRGHTREDLPRQVDDEPLPSHRGGNVPERLPLLVAGSVTTGPWNARPASPAPSSPATDGSRRSAGGRSCSPRRWRSTPGCATGWPWIRRRTCTCCGGPWPRPSLSMRWAWETTDNETGLGTSARVIAECEVGVKTNDRGLGNPQLHALSPASSVDSRRRSWYVFFTTPISSAVGSRPSSGAVSVFVWE